MPFLCFGQPSGVELTVRQAILRRAQSKYPRTYSQWYYDYYYLLSTRAENAFAVHIEKISGPEVRVYYAVLVNQHGNVLMQGSRRGSKLDALRDLYYKMQ